MLWQLWHANIWRVSFDCHGSLLPPPGSGACCRTSRLLSTHPCRNVMPGTLKDYVCFSCIFSIIFCWKNEDFNISNKSPGSTERTPKPGYLISSNVLRGPLVRSHSTFDGRLGVVATKICWQNGTHLGLEVLKESLSYLVILKEPQRYCQILSV